MEQLNKAQSSSVTPPSSDFLGTSISGWGRSVLLALDNLGLDGTEIFNSCGLDPDAQGKALVRNPVSRMQHVWQFAEDQVADKGRLALEIARHLNAGSFHALGFGLYASASIEDLLERLSRFREIISSAVDMKIKRTGSDLRFNIDDRRSLVSPLTTVVFILFLLRVCRELGGSMVMPVRIDLAWTDPSLRSALETLVDCPIHFGAPRTVLYFSNLAVEQAFPSANGELANFQDRLCWDYLASLDEHAHFPSRVRLKIRQGLANDRADVGVVASSLHMSRRSLQRKLRSEGTSYRRILNETRQDLALGYAKNPDLSASAICYLLGFEGLSQFSSAFREWFGLSLSEYRRTLA